MPQSSNTRGIVAMLISTAFFCAMDAVLKKLVAHYPASQVACLRGLASLPFALAPIALAGRWREQRPVNWPLHLLRGVLAIATMIAFVGAIRRSSLSDAYAVFLCAPLLVSALAVVVLGERMGVHRWLAVALGLAGVVVILRPAAESVFANAGLLAFISAACYAASAITARVLSRTDTTPAMVVSAVVVLSVGCGLLALPVWRPVLLEHWPLVIGGGLFAAFGQHFMIEAFRHGSPAVVAPYEYSALLWGIVLDVTLWSVWPQARALLGSLLVVGSGLYVWHRERVEPA